MERRSLALKLTVSYLAASAAVLLASSLALYWTLAHNLARVEIRLLDQKIDLFVQDEASEPGDYVELFQQLSASTQGRDPQMYWVRFVDGKGRSLTETAGMSTLLPATSFDGGRVYSGDRRTQRVKMGDGGVFRLA